jgi:hypothetical protein
MAGEDLEQVRDRLADKRIRWRRCGVASAEAVDLLVDVRMRSITAWAAARRRVWRAAPAAVSGAAIPRCATRTRSVRGCGSGSGRARSPSNTLISTRASSTARTWATNA